MIPPRSDRAWSLRGGRPSAAPLFDSHSRRSPGPLAGRSPERPRAVPTRCSRYRWPRSVARKKAQPQRTGQKSKSASTTTAAGLLLVRLLGGFSTFLSCRFPLHRKIVEFGHLLVCEPLPEYLRTDRSKAATLSRDLGFFDLVPLFLPAPFRAIALIARAFACSI